MAINKQILQEDFKQLQNNYEAVCNNPNSTNVQALTNVLQKFQKDIKDMPV
ncbi:MAG: hypothetical protein K940chlam2_01012 [Chlamydiae bacterium]|nr:hypothetical protein [Chlamydiota bacterium]